MGRNNSLTSSSKRPSSPNKRLAARVWNWAAIEAAVVADIKGARGSVSGLSGDVPITPRLSVLMNVTDLFDSNRTTTTIDTPLLRESSVRRFDGRLVYIGLSYRLGGATGTPARQPGWRERQGQGQGGARPGADPEA